METTKLEGIANFERKRQQQKQQHILQVAGDSHISLSGRYGNV